MSALRAQGPLTVGALVDSKYRIQKLLGSGAMGAVYEVEHTGTGRRLALKVIMGDFARDPNLVSRFHREARAAGAIETQHITQVMDTGVDKESELPFLVMEYMVGEDLQQLIKKTGPIHPDIAMRIVAQACLGLTKAHEAGVVHRDIKPANLFLARRDAGEVIVKLLDFGIAKVKMDQAQEMESAGLTKTGNMLGSPLFMSPEQARGSRDINHRTDIWSMGVVLYQSLSGRTPFQHLTALGELIIAICSQNPPHIQELAPWVPPEVAELVHKCMRHNADDRFQSAQELFQALRAHLPHGWGIHEDMFVPLSATDRDRPAPRLAASIPPPPPMTTVAGPPQGMQLTGVGDSGAGTRGDPSATTSAMAHSASADRPGGSKRGLIVGLSAVAIAAFAGAGYMAFKPPPAPPTVLAAPPPTMAPTIPSAPVTVAAPTIAPVQADVTPRRFKLVILPSDAKVEVDGQAVTSQRGIIEITGTLGSTKSVRVFKGKNEYVQDVAITELGLLPPKVELLPPGAPRPSGSGTAGLPGSSGPVKVEPGIKDKFE